MKKIKSNDIKSEELLLELPTINTDYQETSFSLFEQFKLNMDQEIFFVGSRQVLIDMLDDIKMFGVIKQINSYQNMKNYLRYIIAFMIFSEMIVFIWGQIIFSKVMIIIGLSMLGISIVIGFMFYQFLKQLQQQKVNDGAQKIRKIVKFYNKYNFNKFSIHSQLLLQNSDKFHYQDMILNFKRQNMQEQKLQLFLDQNQDLDDNIQ